MAILGRCLAGLLIAGGCVGHAAASRAIPLENTTRHYVDATFEIDIPGELAIDVESAENGRLVRFYRTNDPVLVIEYWWTEPELHLGAEKSRRDIFVGDAPGVEVVAEGRNRRRCCVRRVAAFQRVWRLISCADHNAELRKRLAWMSTVTIRRP